VRYQDPGRDKSMRFRFILTMVLLLGWRQWGAAEEIESLESPGTIEIASEPVEAERVAESAVTQDPAPVPAPVVAEEFPPAPGATPNASAATTTTPTLATKETFWKGWKQLPKDILRDQKEMWTFPIGLATGKHLKPTIAVVGVTAALVALDGYPATYFSKPNPFGKFNQIFSGPNTARANYIIPLGLYALALIQRDEYAQKTFLLAGEAVINSEILTSVMKDLDRRSNPNDMPPGGPYGESWFKNKFAQNLIGGNGSFPSGHTIAAFSVATVYAQRYSQKKWVKWVAYGLAAVDGFSRVPLQSHYASEVFLGATLGYIFGRQAARGAR